MRGQERFGTTRGDRAGILSKSSLQQAAVLFSSQTSNSSLVASTTLTTITAHHLLYNRNDMLAGGMKPVHYCLPVLKRNVHQAALISAATSGDSSFFIGTDSAPHPRHAKENACGCAAGCYTAHAALELYTEVFEAEGQLDHLEAFTSEFGADFYQVPHNEDYIELIRQDWQVPSALTFGNDELVPTRGGDVVRWQVRTGIGPL